MRTRMSSKGKERKNPIQKRNALELKSRMYLRIYDLRSEQNYAEEKRLYDGLAEAMNKWKEDIANAPEDGGDIYLSNYFSV